MLRASRLCGRVLVAEDDEEMLQILLETLRRDGHEVRGVTDGAALLLELAQSPRFNYDVVDVVIADVRMPLCSGMQALHTIHALRPALPVVLLTAFGDSELHAHAERLKATLLDKPVSMNALSRVVADRIAGRPLPNHA
jgi:two-component system response regulator AtoC